jgi:virginiamycin B lyase
VGITPGPGGNLWFTEYYGNKVGKIGTDGKVSEYPVPASGAYLWDIVAGPNGNIWFTEYGAGNIGTIAP